MHILIGFFVAAVMLCWWAVGGIIPAVMGTLAIGVGVAAFAFQVADGAHPQPWLLLMFLGIGIVVWSPIAIRSEMAKHRMLRRPKQSIVTGRTNWHGVWARAPR